MAFNINEFKSTINEAGGLLKPCNFMVLLTPPPIMRGENSQQLSFMCDRAQLPGIQFATMPLQRWGYGMQEQRPVAGNYGDFTLSFLADANADIIRFFHNWMVRIYNVNSYQRPQSRQNGLKQFDFGYPDDFETVIEVHQFDQDPENPAIIYTLQGCYPKNISDTEVNWASSDDIIRWEIGFVYNSWVSDAIDQRQNTVDIGSTTSTYTIGSKDPNVQTATNAPLVTAGDIQNNVA